MKKLKIKSFAETEEKGDFWREDSYRRGYLSGYSQAMDDIEKKIEPSLFQKWCKFFDGPLTIWRWKNKPNNVKLTPPPSCNKL